MGMLNAPGGSFTHGYAVCGPTMRDLQIFLVAGSVQPADRMKSVGAGPCPIHRGARYHGLPTQIEKGHPMKATTLCALAAGDRRGADDDAGGGVAWCEVAAGVVVDACPLAAGVDVGAFADDFGRPPIHLWKVWPALSTC